MKTKKRSTKCILFFVKYPEKIPLKSRLAKVLGTSTAHQLYECFVIDMLSVIRESRYPFVICFTPGTAAQKVSQWLGGQYEYMPQRGRGLGERMENAFRDVFIRGIDQAILIGSDIPGISIQTIRLAFRKLQAAECIIGPAEDGGYYLIGFNRDSFFPDIFKGIRWSSGTVLSDTIHRFGKGRFYSAMPVMRDIDTFDDLRKFFNGARGTPLESTRTFALLSQIRDMPFKSKRL